MGVVNSPRGARATPQATWVDGIIGERETFSIYVIFSFIVEDYVVAFKFFFIHIIILLYHTFFFYLYATLELMNVLTLNNKAGIQNK